MQRQMQSLVYSYADSPDINDSGMSSDLRIRPSLFSPMVPRPSPQGDGFIFNPVLTPPSPREQNQRVASERLLRSTVGDDSVFEGGKNFQRSESAGDRKYSRMSKSDSYAKKKTSTTSLNNAGQRVSSTSAQTRADSSERGSQTRESGPVPPLKFEQFLARKKRYKG